MMLLGVISNNNLKTSRYRAPAGVQRPRGFVAG